MWKNLFPLRHDTYCYLMKLLLYLFCGLYLCCATANAQTYRFLHHTIQDKHLGEINYHITDSLHLQKKPLLIFLDGSGDHPIFYYKQHEGQ